MDGENTASDTTKTVINCESIVDINFAAELYQHLKAAIEHKHEEVEIHVDNVNRVDGAILQVFLAFVLEAQNTNMKVIWKGVSEAFRRAADLLNLSEHLKLPAAN